MYVPTHQRARPSAALHWLTRSVNVSDVTSSLSSLVMAHRQASDEISHLQPDDPFLQTLQGFIDKSTPKIDKLKQLHRDLLVELSSVVTYFAERGSQVEDIFSTVLTFALNLQKAAVEMTKYPDHAKTSTQFKTPRVPPAIGPKPSIHIAPPSEGTEGDKTPTGTLASQAGLGLGVPSGLDVMGTRRGTLTRGEFDEAIRTIHGGARRRERREASIASSVAGSVKLGRMFLDGSGTGTRARAPTSKASGSHARLGSVFR